MLNQYCLNIFSGKHIRLADRKWAIAVEQAIGNIMTGYLCSCREDERVLLEILSRCVPAHEMDYRPSVTGKETLCLFLLVISFNFSF